MARPRKPANAMTANISKAEREKREKMDAAVTGNANKITVPAFLRQDKVATKEFKRVVKELLEVGLVTNVDIPTLAVYADAYAKYKQCTEELRDQPLLLEYTNKAGATNFIENPLIKTQVKYGEIIRKVSAQFGFDPASRAKIASVKEAEVVESDPLVELLANLK